MRAARALVAVALQQGTDVLIARADDSAVAAGDLLGLLQGEAGDVADGADGLAAVACAPSLGAVLDEDQLVLVGNNFELLHAARITGKVDGDDGFGARRDLAFDVARIEVVGIATEISEDRHSLLVEDADDRADVGDAGRDHFIAGADPGSRDGDVQRGRARGARHDVLHWADIAEALGELGGLRALPVEHRVLLERGIESFAFAVAPARGWDERFLHRFGTAVYREFGGARIRRRRGFRCRCISYRSSGYHGR